MDVRPWVSWPLDVSQHAGRIPSLGRRFNHLLLLPTPGRGLGAPGEPAGLSAVTHSSAEVPAHNPLEHKLFITTRHRPDITLNVQMFFKVEN